MVAIAGLPFHLISIFILGTPNNYWSRMVPITNTWGRDFDHMYFVMGRNRDWSTTKRKCKKMVDSSVKKSDVERYTCAPGSVVAPTLNFLAPLQKTTISFLYSKTCTDKYFGASPTCKLEKAMFYFL